jgi:hypothetical protein
MARMHRDHARGESVLRVTPEQDARNLPASVRRGGLEVYPMPRGLRPPGRAIIECQKLFPYALDVGFRFSKSFSV